MAKVSEFFQGYAEPHVGVTQNLAEGEQGGYHEENGDEQVYLRCFTRGCSSPAPLLSP